MCVMIWRRESEGLSRRRMIAGMAATIAAPAFAAGPAHVELAQAAARIGRGRTLRIVIPDGSLSNVTPVADAFTQMSGIATEIETVGIRDVGPFLQLQAMSGQRNWDVGLPATYDLPDLVQARAILPMPDTADGFRGQESIYDLGNLFDGVRYGYQTDGDAYLMFYNERLRRDPRFAASWQDKTGTAFDPPRSWEVFDKQVRHVSETSETHYGALLKRAPGFVEAEFWLRLHAKGIWPLSPEFQPQIDSPEGVAALAEMIRLEPALTVSTDRSDAFSKSIATFEQGGIYATISWGGTQKKLQRANGNLAGDIRHTAPPGGTGPDTPDALPFFNWGWSYSIPSGAALPELSAMFCAFAVMRAPSLLAVGSAEGFFDPFRAEHYKAPRIREVYGDAFLAVHRDSLAAAMPDFYVADRGTYMSSLAEWILLALAGEISPEDALGHCSDEWRRITDGAGKSGQIRRWNELRAVYPASIAEKLRDPTPQPPEEQDT